MYETLEPAYREYGARHAPTISVSLFDLIAFLKPCAGFR